MANQSPYWKRPDDIGLALSGGGFRATLFHLGSLWRLNELSLLPAIGRISSVSGGSILAGLMATRWSRLDFQDGVATNFQQEIVPPIWRFCSLNIDVRAVLVSFLIGGNALPHFYQKYLLGEHTLQDMPDSPEFVFNATHLETGRNWTFSKALMRTYRLGIIDRPGVLLSKVVAASSAFPPMFPPVVLSGNPDAFRRSEYADLFDRVDLKQEISLTDGGVYDNLGVHSIDRFGTLLVSDASGPLEPRSGWPILSGFFYRSKRPIDSAVEQTRALRRTRIVGMLARKEKRGAWWGIGTRVEDYTAESPFVISKEWGSRVATIRTRLNSFNDEEKAQLINWGYLQCDLAIRSYYAREVPSPSTLPYPEFQFVAAGDGSPLRA